MLAAAVAERLLTPTARPPPLARRRPARAEQPDLRPADRCRSGVEARLARLAAASRCAGTPGPAWTCDGSGC